jgi:hypothetical protein
VVLFVPYCDWLGGFTALDGWDALLVPTAFVAVTVKVYQTPLESPVTVADVADPPAVAVTPPGDEVTVKPVSALPPLFAGAVQLTVADFWPGCAVTPVGGFGTPSTTTLLEAWDAGPSPTAFVATTVNV